MDTRTIIIVAVAAGLVLALIGLVLAVGGVVLFLRLVRGFITEFWRLMRRIIVRPRRPRSRGKPLDNVDYIDVKAEVIDHEHDSATPPKSTSSSS